MTGPVLSPQEIVSNLRDSGVIDQATAIHLEQRITAYAESRAAQGREEGKLEAITDAVKKAEATVNRTRGERQKSAAGKVLWAIRGLLPTESAVRHEIARARTSGYHHGFREGRQSADSERNPRGHR
jgi:flagellar biosynthesis/type III secretory pathway protein FliH